MPPLVCDFPDCKEQVVDTNENVAIVLFNTHMLLHTSYGGSDADKDVSMARPKITQGMSMEEWNSFLAMWRRYRIETDLAEEECALQLILGCEDKLVDQVYVTDPSISDKPVIEQLEAIRRLAVIPATTDTERSETPEMSRKASKLPRAPHTMAQGKTTKQGCKQIRRVEDDLVDRTNATVKTVTVVGLADAKTWLNVGGRSPSPDTPADTIRGMKHTETTLDTPEDEATATETPEVGTGHKGMTLEAYKG